MHIRKLPSGNYNIVAYAGKDLRTGKRIVKSFTGSDLKMLKAAAAAWEYENKNLVTGESFGVIAQRFFESRRATTSPSTLRGYYTIIKQLKSFSWFWRSPIHTIDTISMQQLIDALPYKEKTIKNIISFVSSSMKYAGLRVPPYHLPQIPVPDLHIPDKVTVKRTLNAAEGEMWICIMLAATGPLRCGEICALTMDDIDPEHNIIHVHHSLARGTDNKYHLKAPKTVKSDRYIVMPKEVIQAIVDQGYITHWKPNNLSDEFRRFLKANGIPHYRFHDLRHYCISELLSQGIEEIYIAERSGHSDYATLKRYTHVLNNHRRTINEQILSHFSDLTG